MRMKPGDMVELSRIQATAMATAAKKHGIKTAVRMLSPSVAGVWRTE